MCQILAANETSYCTSDVLGETEEYMQYHIKGSRSKRLKTQQKVSYFHVNLTVNSKQVINA